MLINERPYFTDKVGMLARKDGEYSRPILASMVDMRVEDYVPDKLLMSKYASNYIAKLPDIAELNQVDQFLIVNANLVSRTDVSKHEAERYLKSGQFILLPHSPRSKLWGGSPWWEFTTCFDETGNYIKAPKLPRHGEPSPEEIDEMLDDVDQNRGNIRVVSPQSVERVATRESYIDRLFMI